MCITFILRAKYVKLKLTPLKTSYQTVRELTSTMKKSTKIRKWLLRSELSNIDNYPLFGGPGNNPWRPSFGTVILSNIHETYSYLHKA